MPEKICKNCVFWTYFAFKEKGEELDTNTLIGECKRIPPTPILFADGTIEAVFPPTSAHEQCGEFTLED